jgi:hypothetical protein
MKRLKICLINPKFEPSYWGFDYALPLYPGNIKSTMITGAVPHLAGLIPNREICLLDENVESIDFDSLRRFDIVGVTGMIVQKKRMLEILQPCAVPAYLPSSDELTRLSTQRFRWLL